MTTCHNALRLTAVAITVGLLTGCGSQDAVSTSAQSNPRPVKAVRIGSLGSASGPTKMTGSVGAWKTEDIGFEVAGRVASVIEPGNNIDGRVFDESGRVISGGTELARLDRKRLEIALASAKAAANVARQNQESARIALEDIHPAQVDSAKAEVELRKAELDRAKALSSRGAGNKSELDRANAAYNTATAADRQTRANKNSLQASLDAAKASVAQAVERVNEAQRNLDDTALYSAFRGQVAQVHAVAGTYVQPGTPVLTVQMMDPIKVELEVSAEMSRQFRHGDTISMTSASAGNPLTGFVHMTDPVADPETRTFTVTLLCRNEQTAEALPDGLPSDTPRTQDIWPLNVTQIIGGNATTLVESKSIFTDEKGTYVWKVTNRRQNEVQSNQSRVLDVSKIRINAGDMRIPFLGSWVFVPVTIPSGQDFDPESDLVTGGLLTDGKPITEWTGEKVLYDRPRWRLRPGDLVTVDLASNQTNSATALSLPMRAIRHDSAGTAIFIVDTSATPAKAKRIPVELIGSQLATSGDTLQAIKLGEPDAQAVTADTLVITGGVHFLTDGEEITVVK